MYEETHNKVANDIIKTGIAKYKVNMVIAEDELNNEATKSRKFYTSTS